MDMDEHIVMNAELTSSKAQSDEFDLSDILKLISIMISKKTVDFATKLQTNYIFTMVAKSTVFVSIIMLMSFKISD